MASEERLPEVSDRLRLRQGQSLRLAVGQRNHAIAGSACLPHVRQPALREPGAPIRWQPSRQHARQGCEGPLGEDGKREERSREVELAGGRGDSAFLRNRIRVARCSCEGLWRGASHHFKGGSHGALGGERWLTTRVVGARSCARNSRTSSKPGRQLRRRHGRA